MFAIYSQNIENHKRKNLSVDWMIHMIRLTNVYIGSELKDDALDMRKIK